MPKGQSDGSVIVDILLDGEKAKKYWENFNGYMEMSTKQLEKRLMASTKRINDLKEAYGTISQELRNARKQRLELNFDESKVKALQRTEETLKRISQKRDEIWENRKKVAMYGTADDYRVEKEASEKILASLKEQYEQTSKTHAELKAQYRQYVDLTNYVNQLKDARKEAYNLVKQETAEFEGLNQKYAQIKQNNEQNKRATKETADHTKQIANNTKAIKSHTSNIGANIKSGVGKLADGLKKIVRMSLALIGIRSIYTGISSAMRTWLNSEDELAKKTKANMENLKMNFAQMLQPALTWVINAFNNILALVGAVVKQFTKLNIFAKKTASSTGATSKNVQNTLASFDKIDVLQKNDASGGGDAGIEPDDFNDLMAKYENLAQRIKDILETIFDPFKKAWENKGEAILKDIQTSFENIKGLAEAVGKSFYEVWTNGTIQRTAETILQIFDNIIKTIGNIALAWKKAWEKDDKGTKIVQNLVDAFNELLGIIERISGFLEKVTASEGYQRFIDANVKAFQTLSEIVKFMAETWNDMIKEKSTDWAENVGDVFDRLGKFIERIVEIVNKIKDSEEFKGIYESYVKTIGDSITTLTEWWKVLGDILNLIIDPNWENLKTLGKDWESFGDSVEKTSDSLTELGDKLPWWTTLLPRIIWNSNWCKDI